jgi:hypothetical protein
MCQQDCRGLWQLPDLAFPLVAVARILDPRWKTTVRCYQSRFHLFEKTAFSGVFQITAELAVQPSANPRDSEIQVFAWLTCAHSD